MFNTSKNPRLLILNLLILYYFGFQIDARTVTYNVNRGSNNEYNAIPVYKVSNDTRKIYDDIKKINAVTKSNLDTVGDAKIIISTINNNTATDKDAKIRVRFDDATILQKSEPLIRTNAVANTTIASNRDENTNTTITAAVINTFPNRTAFNRPITPLSSHTVAVIRPYSQNTPSSSSHVRTKPLKINASSASNVAKPYRDPTRWYTNRESTPAPSHTLALFRPYVDQSNFQFVESAYYKPFLRPQDYTLLDQYETHEGEVLEENVPQSDNEYHTIDETDAAAAAAAAPVQISSSDDVQLSYLPSQQLSDDVRNSSDVKFVGYADSIRPLITAVSLTTVEPSLVIDDAVAAVAPTLPVIKSNKNLYALYYIGYKLWYLPVLFSIYHAIMMLFYLLTLLAKHYRTFPVNLQAAASSSFD